MADSEDEIEYDDGFDADDIVADDYDDDTDDEIDNSLFDDSDDDDSDDNDDIDDDDDDDDDTDDYDDATDDEIDFVVAVYREDGEPQVAEMALPLANDLDELIVQLRRLPADAGACAFVSISGEFFVVVRVRGKNVQVLLNDSVAASDWPIARDVADLIGLDIPEDDDESEIVGDLDILSDQGVSEFDMEAIAGGYDEDSGDLVRQIADQMKIRTQFDAATRDR
ncbi:MAG: tRNA adenosine deaminase-associated protein [Propionibacteriaceae bacterium]|nr:tRNA adenosine deaminase-associated protein [Propionibacteriaceae bacterium]